MVLIFVWLCQTQQPMPCVAADSSAGLGRGERQAGQEQGLSSSTAQQAPGAAELTWQCLSQDINTSQT